MNDYMSIISINGASRMLLIIYYHLNDLQYRDKCCQGISQHHRSKKIISRISSYDDMFFNC